MSNNFPTILARIGGGSNKAGVSSRPLPVDENQRKALAQLVYDSKTSLLENKIAYGDNKIKDIDTDLKTVTPTVQSCGSTIANPQKVALEAQKKEQTEAIEAAKKELTALKEHSSSTDSRSTQSLQKELREIKLSAADLTKDREQLDNKTIDRDIQLEMAKPVTPQRCSQAASGPDQNKIKRLQEDQAKNSEDIKVAMNEIKEIHKQMSTEGSSQVNRQGSTKSKNASNSLDQTLKSLVGRTVPLNLEELDKIQTNLGEAMPYLKSSAGNTIVTNLKKSLGELDPQLRNQLNETLAMNDILTNSQKEIVDPVVTLPVLRSHQSNLVLEESDNITTTRSSSREQRITTRAENREARATSNRSRRS